MKYDAIDILILGCSAAILIILLLFTFASLGCHYTIEEDCIYG